MCDDGLDAITLLAQLVDKSLVVTEVVQPGEHDRDRKNVGGEESDGGDGDAGGIRYRLLETLRVYARERLEQSGEAATIAARHAAFYLAIEPVLADIVRARLVRGLPPAGMDPQTRARLGRDIDNLRAALRWSLEHGETERGLLLAIGPLWVVWTYGGRYAEARHWVDAFLAASSDLPDWLRAAAHATAGLCAHFMGDEAEARVRLETSVALSREAGRTRVDALSVLGMARWLEGDDAGAAAAIEESLAGAEAAGDALAVSRALRDLSYVARTQGDYPRARALLERSIAALRGQETHHPGQYARGLPCLGRIAWLAGNTQEAGARLRDALAAAAEHRALNLVPDCLEWLAPILVENDYPREAAQVLGAAEAGRRATDRLRYRRDEPAYRQDVAAIRARLGEDDFRAAWAEGEHMSLEDAAERTLEINVLVR